MFETCYYTILTTKQSPKHHDTLASTCPTEVAPWRFDNLLRSGARIRETCAKEGIGNLSACKIILIMFVLSHPPTVDKNGTNPRRKKTKNRANSLHI